VSRGTKPSLEAALRERPMIIGLLECCRCTYPLETHATETKHAEHCPAHAITLSARAARSLLDATARLVS